MRRLAVMAVAILGLVSTAEALTVRDIIELSRAGLGEEVLLAMIEVDGGVYQVDPNTLKSLKQAGVPERVIVALVRSGRQRPLPEPIAVAPPIEDQRPAEPQVVVIDHHNEPRTREVMVPVPIYVPVPVTRIRRHDGLVTHTPVESTYVPFQTGPPPPRQQVPRGEPVYWGFGGKLRPDAWQPDGHRRHEHQGQDIQKTDGQKRPDKN